MKLRRRFFIACLAALTLLSCYVAYQRIARELRKDNRIAWQHYNRGLNLQKQRKLEEAEKEFLLAIDFAADVHPDMLAVLGNLYFMTNRCSEAIRLLENVLTTESNKKPMALQQIALCHAEAGESKEALATINFLKQNHPQEFTSRHESLLLSLQKEVKQKVDRGKTRKVVLQFRLPGQEKRDRSLWLTGNWNATGHQDDIYGYQRRKLLRRENGDYFSEEKLRVGGDFPFMVFVKNAQGRTIGMKRFTLNKRSSGSLFIDIPSERPKVFYALRKRPELNRRRSGADGQRRVFVFWPDCGSWWILRSLIERNMTPNAEDMLARGSFAEMRSIPPLTSVAIQRITTLSESISLWRTFLIQLKGIELLDPFIPLKPDTERTLANYFTQNDISFVDLTFQEPFVRNEGDQSEEHGFDTKDYIEAWHIPGTSPFSKNSVARKYLDPEKIRLFLESRNVYGQLLLATQWDDSEKKVQKAIDIFTSEENPRVMLLRLPGLDLLSHYYFENRAAYSEKNLLLESFYLYLDDVIGRLRNLLDQDDTFILISDHGIKNTFSHHPVSIFMAEGELFKAGQALKPFPIERFSYFLASLAKENRLIPDISPNE